MNYATSSRDVAIVGRACRLPNAPSVDALWTLLTEGRCAVGSIPPDRWHRERYWHPRVAERGKTYSFAAGVLDDIWGFDAAAFGISPREAEQMDPQQRLALELAWEAMEDAGIPPSKLAGSQTGVFVGASAVDHANLRLVDMAAADAYMMTGNTLSVISNRLSYIFDLHGPSLTVDTACSSSLVAVNEALASLRSGRVDTAIVAGISLLVSPQSFIGFSQAAMLSRRGLCQAFSAHADGYVRAEGGIVLVLKTCAAAARDATPIHAIIVDADVNSDGRTNGISLPSKASQAQLLERVYTDNGLDPAALAFVEAHGTGTPVGDPIEAAAIGETLGRRREAPLLIGSIKTNIGHMEAAAGLAGVLKAMLALEHDRLPASLHGSELNPAIDFDGLNLVLARILTPLDRPRARRRLAGVNAFGFGGTNAHVVLTDAPQASVATPAPNYLVISAHSRAALAALAADYATRLQRPDDVGVAAVVAAAAHGRDRLAQSIVLPVGPPARMAAALDGVTRDEETVSGAVRGTAKRRRAPVAFVFSGNGSQFVGMGLPAYRHSAIFRARLDQISDAFAAIAGWSIVDALQADDLAAQLVSTRIAQPLLFAIQSAACHALRHHGLEPALVLGHSVGEIAAAEAAGLLDGNAALQVIHARSLHQELAVGLGGMAVVIGPREATAAALAEVPGLEIAAFNSPRAVTVSGGADDLDRLADAARRHKVRVRKLDLAYPFHSALMAPVEGPLLQSLARIPFGAQRVPFVSTVTGRLLADDAMDRHYWWRNVREPVRFSDAITTAVDRGVGLFVEIGPSAMLLPHIGDVIEGRGAEVASLAALDTRDRGTDPLAMTMAAAIASGAQVDDAKAFGPAPGGKVALPHYPWQRKPYRLAETSETPASLRAGRWHPLVGARSRPEVLEWQTVLDVALHPWLADHCVDGRIILPGAAFVEMGLAVARDWLETDAALVADIEITSPMQLASDASRDVLCRVSEVGRRLEVLSRPRLSASPWQTHATAKIVRDPTVAFTPAPWKGTRSLRRLCGADIYARAERAGLCYGPAFRKLAAARVTSDTRILVDLSDEAPRPGFGIDPARFDACFHALTLLLPDGHEQSDDTTYIPVRFGEVLLRKPHVPFTTAQIDVTRCDARFIVADMLLVDATGEVVASIRDARFQAMRRQSADATRHVIRQTLVLAPEPTATRHDRALPLETLRDAIVDAPAALGDDGVLLEGWATVLALRVARALATDDVLDVDALFVSNRFPAPLRPWLEQSLIALERSGLCRRDGHRLVIDSGVALPEPDEILRAVAREHQPLAVELLAATGTQAAVEAVLAGHGAPGARRTVQDLDTESHVSRACAAALHGLVRASVSAWPRDRATRILQLGHGALTPRAAALAAETGSPLTIFDPDRRRLEGARAAFADAAHIALVETIDDLPFSGFDLVLAAASIDRCLTTADLRSHLRHVMAPQAILAAVEPQPSLFRDTILGFDAGSREEATWRQAGTPGKTDWTRTIAAIGLEAAEVTEIATSAGAALIMTARAPAARRRWTVTGTIVIVGDECSSSAQASFATLLAASGVHVSILRDSELTLAGLDTPSAIVVFVGTGRHGAPCHRLGEACMRLKQLVESVGRHITRFWLVTSGGVARGGCDDDVAAALWAFSRTLANELTTLDIRRVDVAPELRPDDLADRLRDIVLSQTDETEIVVDAKATRVVRFSTASLASCGTRDHAEAARLQRGDGAGVDRLRWQATSRVPPAPGEVEIAVDAIGLNFRDVMFGLGLLPEDILEHGFAGPTLGLECVGRITRIGEGAAGFTPGDRVMAFARGAFATHVVTPAALVAAIPDGVTPEAAATIPVAFMTAYYALITCARLKPQDWVLIHGGAGGVGLAALQIARWRGARVIATAGTAAKRALLLVLGAEHAFDSRSGGFVHEVRRATGDGVAVVLNSLSGEAMERSIACLRPFGRFVELGKRDYVADTHIGLRPFRRNLSYFGVDLDQLLIDDAATSRRVMRAVMRLFARGALVPLPYRTFEAAETSDAFRLMQQSRHVGKIVVRPPDPSRVDAAPVRKRFAAAADKMHLVTGGFGGFGLATARWLAAAGARHVMLIGRKGAASDDAHETIRRLRAQDIHVVAESCDVADRVAMEALFARFGDDLPPLAGIVHAAMVLDDALLANVTPDAFARVLRPKVAGADNLDRLTRDMALEYFVLYSSVAALLGNPGQAAYVAANGYLEGLARRRRRDGLPAHAIAWGAISDVGVLARSETTRDLLETRAGLIGLSSLEALRALGDILSMPSDDPERAVVTIAPLSWATARRHLAVLKAPAYAALVSRDETVESARTKIDIAALVGKSTPEAARTVIGGLIVEEIARVLRLPPEEVARTTPLAEIGLDSLMAVELALALEGSLTLDSPLSAAAGSFSVDELADHVIAVSTGAAQQDASHAALARTMLGRHVEVESDAGSGRLDSAQDTSEQDTSGRDWSAQQASGHEKRPVASGAPAATSLMG